MMLIGHVLRAAAVAAMLSGATLLTGCGDGGGGGNAGGDVGTPQAEQDPELALILAPRAGDLYAAELSAFSTASFDDVDGKLYGLMRVVDADASRVIVVTENAASQSPKVAGQDILGDLAGIEFDEQERINIALAELRTAWNDGRIYEVRRR